MKILVKIKSDINEVSKIKNRLLNLLEEPRMLPTDGFLIKWIISFLPKELSNEICINTLEIYEFMKKYLTDVNSSQQ